MGQGVPIAAELEQQGDDTLVVKVTEGAPFDMQVTLSVEGGTLSATTVTVEGGSDSSEPVTVTRTGEEGTQVTVSVGSVTFQNYEAHHTRALKAGAGAGLTLPKIARLPVYPLSPEPHKWVQTLTASTSDIGDVDGLTNVSYSYQWLADDTEIDGATSSTYTVQSSDNGKVIKVQVTFTDDGGSDESLTSAGTSAVVLGGL